MTLPSLAGHAGAICCGLRDWRGLSGASGQASAVAFPSALLEGAFSSEAPPHCTKGPALASFSRSPACLLGWAEERGTRDLGGGKELSGLGG